jgi:hypothetical protein
VNTTTAPQPSTPAPLADGVYTWAAVQPSGPSVTVSAQVLAGRVSLYVTGTHGASPRDLGEGQAAYLLGVQAAVTGRTRYGTGPVSFTPAAQPIGKARARELHRIMGRLGLPSAQHYALAAAALGEWAPVPSLADLYPVEARAVWRHLCALYPSAAQHAA